LTENHVHKVVIFKTKQINVPISSDMYHM